MNYIFENIPICPIPGSAGMLAILNDHQYSLYGAYIIKGKVIGSSCQSGFEKLDPDTLADGAYFIDTGPVPKENADLFYSNGPTVDIQLPPFTISFGGNNKTYKDIITAINDKQCLQLMSLVSIDICVQIWRVLGAKIGRKIENKIIFEKQKNYSELIKPN